MQATTKKHVIRAAVICIAAVIFTVAAVKIGYAVYDRVGRNPLRDVTAEKTERVLMTYEPQYKPIQIIDHDITGKPDASEIFDALAELRVYFPHDDQDMLFYGNSHEKFTFVMKNGETHELVIVGQSDNRIETDYFYFDGSMNRTIWKEGIPSYYLKIDGILYDIRDAEVYERLCDKLYEYVEQYQLEHESEVDK